MRQLYDSIFCETIEYEDRHTSPRNLYVIRQNERSLMVDTSFRYEADLRVVERMLEELGVPCQQLDVFITHDHPDHSGLVPDLAARGARIFMNPEETRKRADLLHCYLAGEQARIDNFRTIGVTPERTPEVYKTMMEYTNRVFSERRELPEFDFIPVYPGEELVYGPYRFEVISLKGHTYGQCGLFERSHKLLFCGDQIMTSIVPIVGSQQKDLGLLACYLDSLGTLKHEFADCRMFPCHYERILDVGREADRIILGYLDKCSIMLQVLSENRETMTTRDVGIRTYGRSEGPPDYAHFVSCTQIWAKTFSCLEYLHGEGFVVRSEKDGIIFWEYGKSERAV